MDIDVETTRAAIMRGLLGRTLATAFADTAAREGEAPAYRDRHGDPDGWRTLTWAELRESTLDAASALVDLGVEPGDTVAIMASNRIEHVLADLGAMHAGAVPMSIYNTLSADQVAFVAGDARPRVAILENADHVARWAKAIAADPTVAVATIEDTGTTTWVDLLERGRSTRGQHAEEVERRWRAIDLDQPATILYTSGTTGNPKGVVISHRNVLFEADSTKQTADRHEDTVWISYLPFAHIAERMLGIYLAILDGGNVYLIGDPAQLLPTLQEVRPTAFFGVPRVWEKIQAGIAGLLAAETDEAKRATVQQAMATGLEYVESLQTGHTTSKELRKRFEQYDGGVLAPMRALLGLDRVEWAGSASAPMPLETARFFAGLGMRIYDIYGMTETTGSVTACGPNDFRLGTVGRAQPGIEVTLAQDGEILTRGPVNTSGYHHQAEATAALIDRDGWVHTGDIGHLDEDSFLSVVDRKKELIITSSGKNIAPSNIENLLKESPLVGHALAYGDGRPYVVALLTLDPEMAPLIAAKAGVQGRDLAALARDETVLGLVQQAIDRANDRLSRPEQVKKWALLGEEWTAESAELTPTLKLKRRVVHERHSRALESLYG